MKYKDGNNIEIGDRVLWNDARGVGYVDEIVECSDDLEIYGLKEAGIFIRISNPVISNEPIQRFFIEEKSLEDLGVWPPSLKDSDEISKVENFIENKISASSKLCYSLYRRDPMTEKWHVNIFKDGKIEGSYEIDISDSS